MSHHTRPRSTPRRQRGAAAAAAFFATMLIMPTALAVNELGDSGSAADVVDPLGVADHLVVSEVMTGGASASDEFIEIYNPASTELPLDGLELVYVTASGATVTRKASWDSGVPGIAAGAHLLLANDAGAFAALADVAYAGGLSAVGGSVALRVAGGTSAVDAVGWGTAASSWLEGTPAPAPAAGHSLERLPGGAAGSTQDLDDNASDFVEVDAPDPQNSASGPVPSGGPTPTSTPTPTPTPTPAVTPLPTATPMSDPATAIVDARALEDGSAVTIEGTAVTDSSFADGGGFVMDATGGIAVLVADGAFARGDLLRVSGTVDNRYQQRTLRATGTGITPLGAGTELTAEAVSTASIGEALEGRMVEVGGALQGGPTALTGAVAFDLDDGSGAVRIYVSEVTGIDTAQWAGGLQLRVRGVVGQRDASGTGTGGYRVMPRDPADVADLGVPTPTPTPTVAPTPGVSDSPSQLPLLTIAQARAAGKNEQVRIRGVVTLPTGLMDPGSAALQDGTGAIFLRPSDEAGPLSLGQEVEVLGTRSTWTGMESVRMSTPPTVLGILPLPEADDRSTGAVGEQDEAHVIKVQGEVVSAPQRTSAQNMYFELDDGSGPLRVFVSPRSGIATAALSRGALLEITGVLLQETTGKQPERGYRLWPSAASSVIVMGAADPDGIATDGPTPDGGVLGVGGASGSDGTAGSAATVRPQAAPRLAAAAPTTPPPVAVTVARADAAGEGDVPLPPAIPAGLAAIALAGTGALLAREGLAQRLAAQFAGRGLNGKSDGAGGEDTELPTKPAAIAELVPLNVAPRNVVRTDGPAPEHGGILPRT